MLAGGREEGESPSTVYDGFKRRSENRNVTVLNHFVSGSHLQ